MKVAHETEPLTINNKPACKEKDMQQTERTNIDHRLVTFDQTFKYRSGDDSAAHLEALRRILRNTGKLDPVTVWCEQNNKGETTGRMVLLDGHYRVGAYRAEQAEGHIAGRGIPANVVSGTRAEAHLVALTLNSKETLPLTPQERLNAAWRLVREFRNDISKKHLSKASGVAERTIANMRSQLRKFREAKELPEGNWLIDRNWPEKKEFTPPSEEARRAVIEALSKDLKEAFKANWVNDVEIIGEALINTFGERRMKLVTDAVFGGGDEEHATAWMSPDDIGQVSLQGGCSGELEDY